MKTYELDTKESRDRQERWMEYQRQLEDEQTRRDADALKLKSRFPAQSNGRK